MLSLGLDGRKDEPSAVANPSFCVDVSVSSTMTRTVKTLRLIVGGNKTLTRTAVVRNNNIYSSPSPRALSSSSKGKKGFVDPQEEAQGRINENVGKLSGIEAVEALPASIRRNNQLMAAGLLGFVGYVFWYSMSSVGMTTGANSSNDPIAKLEQEAMEARRKKQSSEITQQEAQELANLDMGVSEKDLSDGDVTLAVAAPDAIATEEEAQNKNALEKKQRSVWNRIIFFWK